MITNVPAYYIFGANTDIGKTIFSTGLCKEASKNNMNTSYIKPVQTGVPHDCDSSFVTKHSHSNKIQVTTLFSFEKPVSPHRAILKSSVKSNSPDDSNLDSKIITSLKDEVISSNSEYILIEGAGGVCSPTPQGQLQCNLYREIRLPVIFIADSKLGGISTSISSIEALETRGFDICCVLLFSGDNENYLFLEKYCQNKYTVFHFQNLTPDTNLVDWFENNSNIFNHVLNYTLTFHKKNYDLIQECKHIAKKHVWWPFTQHKIEREVGYIDSALNDSIVFEAPQKINTNNLNSKNCYDASASWWTQGIGHSSIKLALSAAHAAGKYGHVMFPGHIHAPSAKLIQTLIDTVGKDWASRVFFSDNGSTAVEVALKMAFRKSLGRPSSSAKKALVLGLKDSYHGDTHGAMNATSPNIFKFCDHWYNPQGYWLSYPTVFLKNSQYCLFVPNDFLSESNSSTNFQFDKIANLQNLFSDERLTSELSTIYESYINKCFLEINSTQQSIGCLLLEPILQGSGGMKFVDPLFQKILIKTCQDRNIPVVFDEVFTGFWRLGKISAASMLNVKPDIACYAKLLTGGLLPMAVTLSNEVVFNCFLDDSLALALLHGHSYTAHPIGCAVSLSAIEETQNSLNFNKETFSLIDIWDMNIIKKISNLKNVEKVFAIGSVFSLELTDRVSSNTDSYISTTSQTLIKELNKLNIDARPLGNVVYIMAGFNSSLKVLNKILEDIYRILKNEEDNYK